MVERGNAGQAFVAEQRHMGGEGERAEACIGADVRGGFVAADVLLAG